MGIALYMDHHVPRAITLELRRRGVDVLTAFEDGTAEEEDPALLDRAGELGRVLFTRDDDLLREVEPIARDLCDQLFQATGAISCPLLNEDGSLRNDVKKWARL